MKMLFPDASMRSPTAVPGRSDMRDENIYTALVVSDTANGNTTVFTVPRGQTVPVLGSGTPAAHQKTYTELTTNISQAGQLGAAIGDASLRGIGIVIENASYNTTTGAPSSYGATPVEVAEILAKCFFQLRIGGKLQIQGPAHQFPATGGANGFLSYSLGTAAAHAVGFIANGNNPAGRTLKLPVLVARNDTVEGTFGVAGGASLAFSASQPTLVWVNVKALVKGDAR